MKHMRKIASFLLALAMVLSLATTAFAYTIALTGTTDEPTDGHTYEVYQIFTGDLHDADNDPETTPVLSNVKYGANYGTEGEEVPESVLTNITDAKTFADQLMDGNTENGEISGTPVATLDKDNNWTATVYPGYYLIVDVTENVPAGDSKSAYIVQVVDDVKMAPKSDTITSDKVISSDNYADNYVDSDDSAGADDSVTTDGKTSNGGVGSTVTFTLTVTLPENAKDYSYYYCVLNDTLSEGLTFDASSVVVTVDGNKLTKDADYKLYDNTNADETDNADAGLTFQVAMLDAKDYAGKTITVTYNAVINENAEIGVVGNPNKFDVTYSNDPEYDYDESTDGKPNDDEKTVVGKTPEKKTHTYVTGIKILKVDQNGKSLTGAGFTIEGTSVKYVVVSEEVYKVADDKNAGEYWKLTDGTYTTEEPTEDTEESYADAATKYYKTVEYKVIGDDEAVKTTVMVDENGVACFIGLGEGEYTITETVTPDGYNTIDPIKVTIDWTAPADLTKSTDCTWTVTASNVTGELKMNTEGVYELTVINNAGTILPETGGIGTTLFYVIGGVLVLAAVVLLVTKKRMGAA